MRFRSIAFVALVLFQTAALRAQNPTMTISHAGLSPSSTLTVESGQEITFIYGGGGPHPMTSGQGSTPSPIFFPTVTVNSSHPSATFTLVETGTYLFHCATNPGNTNNWGTIYVEAISNIDEPPALPAAIQIMDVYPNPFNPSTNFIVDVNSPERFDISIYSIDGRRIRNLATQANLTGRFTFAWEGLDDHDHPVASGTYLVSVSSMHHQDTRTITLLR